MIPPLVSLALDYYRNPLSYGHLADGSFPLPRGFTQEFSALCSALSPQHMDTTAQLLNSSADELEAAARFFARHVLLDPSVNHYRCLGVSPRATRDEIRLHYLFLIKLFHPDRLHEATAADVACSRRVNAAYEVLADADKRARYDQDTLGPKRKLTYSDPREFFGPHGVPLRAAEAPHIGRFAGRRRAVGIVLVGVVLLGGAGALALWSLEPMRSLRAQRPAAQAETPPLPYYLRREAATDPAPGRAEAPATPAAIAAPATAAAASADAGAVATDTDAAAIGSRIAERLQIALRRGDTALLAELLANPAAGDPRLPADGPLDAAQRRLRADGRLWLALEHMTWQWLPDGRIAGRGRAVVTERGTADATPTELTTNLTLELVPVDAHYRIQRIHLQDD